MNNLNYTIRIAIAGKRDHPNLESIKTDGRIEKVLKNLVSQFKITPNLQLQFLTGLADGADQIVTEKILNFFDTDEDAKITNPHITAVIPFIADLYRDHPLYPIDKENKNRFNYLIGRCDKVLSINNEATSKIICDEKYAYLNEATDRGYEAQALLMLRRCDILLAIADLRDPVKTGGTIHTINKARAFHIPVILISLEDNKIHMFNDDSTYIETVELSIKKAEKEHETIKEIGSLFEKIISLQTPVYQDGLEIDLEKLINVPNYQTANTKTLLQKNRHMIWDKINSKLKILAKKDVKDNSTPYTLGNKTIISFRDNIDDVNMFFSYQYRGGFILNNLLAVVAVIIAVAMLFLIISGFLWVWSEMLIFSILMLALIAAKYRTLKSIEKNTKSGQNENWNELSIITRYLAERLRVFDFLFLNGILKGIKPSPGKHLNNKFKGSPPEAIFRKIEGIISFEDHKNQFLDPITNIEIFNESLIQSQIYFHKLTSRKYDKMDNFLENWGRRLNKATIYLVVIDFFILIFSFIVSEYYENGCFIFIEILHKYFTPLFIGLTALFPALVAALNAIRFQSESKKLKERYKTMHELLSEKSDNIRKIIIALRNDSKGSEILELFPLITEIEQIMLDEVSDWSLLYSKDFYEPG